MKNTFQILLVSCCLFIASLILYTYSEYNNKKEESNITLEYINSELSIIDIQKITIDDKGRIELLRIKYESLTRKDKKRVLDYQKLLDLEKKIERLNQLQIYSYNYLNNMPII